MDEVVDGVDVWHSRKSRRVYRHEMGKRAAAPHEPWKCDLFAE
jgi:hypothetical protein